MSSSSVSWITSLSCSSSTIQSSDTTSPLSVALQWAGFVFLSPCPQRALYASLDLLFLFLLLGFAIIKLCSRRPASSLEKPLIRNNRAHCVTTNLWFKLALILSSILAINWIELIGFHMEFSFRYTPKILICLPDIQDEFAIRSSRLWEDLLTASLAGKLDSKLEVSGKITYNGHEMHEFVLRKTSAYISQNDLHIGEMTVKETLAFSARCQGVGTQYEMLKELSRREVAANIKPDPDLDVYMKAAAMEGQKENVITNYVLKILGLDICADTMVGNEMMRGISGGQKKRVTKGEMLVGLAKALFMDEISTGLDSSTTFQIVNSLRQSVHIMGGTALISLLQPAFETYDLFDDIVLLSDGQIVYNGPRQNVLEFFESMGFKCPERKGVADFL